MGQKINPYGFRLGITTDWKSRWFSVKEYRHYLTEDWKIRDYLTVQLADAAVSRIEIERTRDRMSRNIDELGDRLSPSNLKEEGSLATNDAPFRRPRTSGRTPYGSLTANM